MNHFLGVESVPNLETCLQEALYLKDNPHAFGQAGAGKTLGLIFLNASLRTRMSTQKAAQLLGMHTICLNMDSEGWKLEFEDGAVMNGDKAEHIKDAVAVLGQYVDILAVRAFPTLTDRQADYAERVLHDFVRYSGVPIVNMESATKHPLQSLADLLTIETHKRTKRPKVVLTWTPHPKALPQAVANSFLEWTTRADYEVVVTHPEGYELAGEFMQGASLTYRQDEALEEADFVYAKNWSAYRDYGRVLSQASDWTITAEKMQRTRQAYFMHCLPVRRNVEVTDNVIDGDHSLVLAQAANRVPAAQWALLHALGTAGKILRG